MTLSVSALPGKMWQGLSSDTKPLQSSNNEVSGGDFYLATDTHVWYVYNVASGWTLWPAGAPVPSGALR